MLDLKEKICYNCIYYAENDRGSYYCEIFNMMVFDTKKACENFKNDYAIDDDDEI